MRRETAEYLIVAFILVAIACIALLYLPATLGAKESVQVYWRGNVAVIEWEQEQEGSAVIWKCRKSDCFHFIALLVDNKTGHFEVIDTSPWPGAEYYVSVYGASLRVAGPAVLMWRYWFPLVYL